LIAFGVYAGQIFKIYKSPDFDIPWIYRILGKLSLLAVPAGVTAFANTYKNGNPYLIVIFGSALPNIVNGFLLFSNVESLILKSIGVKPKKSEKVEKIMVYSY